MTIFKSLESVPHVKFSSGLTATYPPRITKGHTIALLPH